MNNSKVPHKEPRQLKKWACHKFECIGEYIKGYVTELIEPDSYFMELFPGDYSVDCQTGECPVNNPRLSVLRIRPGFIQYILLAKDHDAAEALNNSVRTCGDDISIISGSIINNQVIKQFFDLVPRSASSIILIDPSGYRKLRWTTIKKLATHGTNWQGHKPELLIIFPLEMALARNLTRPQCQASIIRFYGNSKWFEIRQKALEKKIGPDEIRQRLVKLYKAGLKNLGYRYVVNQVPPRFSNPPFYNVIWASDKDNQREMLKKVWTKPRYLPCELFSNV
jgi:three-Cys-motif partner protein